MTITVYPVANGPGSVQLISQSYAAPAAAMTALSAAGISPRLERTPYGSPYVLETYVSLVTRANILGPEVGFAELVPAAAYSPVVGNADTDEAVFRAASTIGGASLGSLQAAARKRSRVIRLNFNPLAGPTPTPELRLRSVTGQAGTLYVAYGADVTGFEVVRVSSAAIVGGGPNYDCLLDQPLWQNHGSGTTVYAVTTLVRDVFIEGLHLNFAGTSHAAGIMTSAVDGAWIRRCKFSGFSRAQHTNLAGSRGVVLQDCITELGTNSVLRNVSSDFEVTGLRTKRGGARRHTNGIARALITVRHASRGTITDTVLEGGSCAISWWGGSAYIDTTVARDMNPRVRADSDTELMVPSGAGSAVSPSALDMGCFVSPSAWGEFGLGHSVKMRIEDCGGIDPGVNFIYPAAFVCDVYGSDYELDIVNTGAGISEYAAPSLAGTATGLTLYDVFDGRFKVRTKGIEAPVRLEGNSNYCRFETVEIDPFDGLTSVNCTFLKIGSNGALGGVSFGHVKVFTNDGFLIRAGYAAPTVASMMAVTIDRLQFENTNLEWEKCLFFRQTEAVAVAPGEEMEYFATTVSATACRGARNPSTALTQDKLTVICGFDVATTASPAQNTWCLGAIGSSRAVKSTTTLAYGDKLTAVAPPSRDLAVSLVADEKGIVTRLAAGGLVQTYRR